MDCFSYCSNESSLVTKEQVDELIANKENIDIDRATEIENIIHHDLRLKLKHMQSNVLKVVQ